ncbi:MAG TPA: hypothetical protein DCG28_05055 [Lachnospiraceae bacterium]|nr:hypothetical protein [Lachnospiraceae bacterium]
MSLLDELELFEDDELLDELELFDDEELLDELELFDILTSLPKTSPLETVVPLFDIFAFMVSPDSPSAAATTGIT